MELAELSCIDSVAPEAWIARYLRPLNTSTFTHSIASRLDTIFDAWDNGETPPPLPCAQDQDPSHSCTPTFVLDHVNQQFDNSPRTGRAMAYVAEPRTEECLQQCGDVLPCSGSCSYRGTTRSPDCDCVCLVHPVPSINIKALKELCNSGGSGGGTVIKARTLFP